MEQPILPLRDAPVLADAAAVWFSRRWGIPAESYRESMEQCLRRKAPVPQWYVVRDGGRLLAGAGVIANDFHDRKDLTPNLCALFVEPPWRGRGTAGRLLDFIRPPPCPPRPAPVCRRTQSALDIPRVSGDNVRCYFL